MASSSKQGKAKMAGTRNNPIDLTVNSSAFDPDCYIFDYPFIPSKRAPQPCTKCKHCPCSSCHKFVCNPTELHPTAVGFKYQGRLALRGTPSGPKRQRRDIPFQDSQPSSSRQAAAATSPRDYTYHAASDDEELQFVTAAEYFTNLNPDDCEQPRRRRGAGGGSGDEVGDGDGAGARSNAKWHWMVVLLALAVVGISSAMAAQRLYGELLLA